MSRQFRPRCSHSQPDSRPWKIRRAGPDDCSSIAHVWQQALALKGHASWQWALQGSPEKQQQAVQEQLETKFLRKKKATAAARKLLAADSSLPTKLSSAAQRPPQLSLFGLKVPLPAAASQQSNFQSAAADAESKRQAVLSYLRRFRCPFCLVAEAGENGSRQVVGYILLSLAQPQALMPPPFPTSAPRRFYVEAIAILPQYQRRGIGSALLAAAERLGRRLEHPSIWLQVSASNKAAQALYLDLGYTIRTITRAWPLQRQYLMNKPLTSPRSKQHRAQGVARDVGLSGKEPVNLEHDCAHDAGYVQNLDERGYVAQGNTSGVEMQEASSRKQNLGQASELYTHSRSSPATQRLQSSKAGFSSTSKSQPSPLNPAGGWSREGVDSADAVLHRGDDCSVMAGSEEMLRPGCSTFKESNDVRAMAQGLGSGTTRTDALQCNGVDDDKHGLDQSAQKTRGCETVIADCVQEIDASDDMGCAGKQGAGVYIWSVDRASNN